jgi:hypothetical protein
MESKSRPINKLEVFQINQVLQKEMLIETITTQNMHMVRKKRTQVEASKLRIVTR